MAIARCSSSDEASDSYVDSDFIPIVEVIEAVQALPNMDDKLILDACDFLENKKNAQIFMALGVKLRRKWLTRKLPRQIRISVKTVDGGVIGLGVLTSEKVAEVKAKIGAKAGISAQNQQLICGGKEAVDDRLLEDYDVRTHTTMILIERRYEIPQKY